MFKKNLWDIDKPKADSSKRSVKVIALHKTDQVEKKWPISTIKIEDHHSYLDYFMSI